MKGKERKKERRKEGKKERKKERKKWEAKTRKGKKGGMSFSKTRLRKTTLTGKQNI